MRGLMTGLVVCGDGVEDDVDVDADAICRGDDARDKGDGDDDDDDNAAIDAELLLLLSPSCREKIEPRSPMRALTSAGSIHTANDCGNDSCVSSTPAFSAARRTTGSQRSPSNRMQRYAEPWWGRSGNQCSLQCCCNASERRSRNESLWGWTRADPSILTMKSVAQVIS